MKTAICFFGLPRVMEISYILQKWYFIDPFKSDIFIHTWDIDHGGYRFKTGPEYEIKYHDSPPSHQKSEAPGRPCFSSEVDDFIRKVIKPKKFKRENYNEFKDKYGDSSTAAMYYSIKSVFELLKKSETKKKYDFVIFTRFDLIPKMGLIQSEIEISMNTNCIFTSVNRTIECFPTNWPVKRSDMLIFGNRESISSYADSFTFWLDNRDLLGEQVFINNCFSKGVTLNQSEMEIMLIQKFTNNEIYANFLSHQE